MGLTTKSLAERWARHVQMACRGSEYALHCAIRKYGAENFHIESYASAIKNTENLKQLERLLIAQENCMVPHGYNMTAGGDGALNLAPESREKLAAKQRGKKASLEAKRKMSIAAATRERPPLSVETKEKIAAAQRGKPRAKHTDETKEKCRIAGKKRKPLPLSVETKDKVRATKARNKALRLAQTPSLLIH